MKISRRVLIGAGAGIVLAAGGTGVALATGNSGGGEQNEPQSAPVPAAQAAQAKAAALKITGGGTVTALESDNEKGASYEVEVKQADGRSVDVRLDSAFALVGRPEANNDANEHGEHQDKGDGDGETADDNGAADRGDGDGETNDDHGAAGKVDRGDGDGETADDAPAATATR